MNILVVSGGSGGHINPAMELIKNITDHRVIYLGTNSKIENNKLKYLNIKYYLLNNKGLKKGIKNKIIFIYYLFINFFKVYKIIQKEQIDKIITFGGYSASSVFLANLFLKKEIYIHEQNVLLGRNNKIMIKFCKKIFTSFNNTRGIKEKYLSKVVYSGNPSFFKKREHSAKFNILIMTGSLGSSSVSEKLLSLLDYYENIMLIGGINNNIQHNKVLSYCDNMEEILTKVDLVITRAGATSLNEISSLGIPSIIIPSPYVINNHQEENAKEYLKVKRGYLINEDDLDVKYVISLIDKIINNPFLYEELSKNTRTFYNCNAIKIIKEEMKL